MGLEREQNRDMDLDLSTDQQPRLKWTAALHQRFIEAVTQLGGSERATPLWLMKVMRIPGLTLFHVKSHLQKYRLENKEHLGSCNCNEQEDCMLTQTLQMEIEMQNKIDEQIEVQKHLQLQIEAQGMYLQSMLKKAQEALAGCHYSPDISELVSSDETGCLSLNLTKVTTDCSADSTLTTSECSERMDGELPSVESSHRNRLNGIGLNYVLPERKRNRNVISDDTCVEHSTTIPHSQQKPSKLKKFGYSEVSTEAGIELDLNYVPLELFDEP